MSTLHANRQMVLKWEQYAAERLVGRTIVRTRYLTKEEAWALGWYPRALVLELDNGALLFASSDDEGNGPGALFGQGPAQREIDGVTPDGADRGPVEVEEWTFPVILPV